MKTDNSAHSFSEGAETPKITPERAKEVEAGMDLWRGKEPNTMENLTKEQAITKLWEDLSAIRDKYFLFEHESQVIGNVLDFLNDATASGSVAAPKEEPDLKVLQDRFKNDYANEIFRQENASLRDQLNKAHETIGGLLASLNEKNDLIVDAHDSIVNIMKVCKSPTLTTHGLANIDKAVSVMNKLHNEVNKIKSDSLIKKSQKL